MNYKNGGWVTQDNADWYKYKSVDDDIMSETQAQANFANAKLGDQVYVKYTFGVGLEGVLTKGSDDGTWVVNNWVVSHDDGQSLNYAVEEFNIVKKQGVTLFQEVQTGHFQELFEQIEIGDIVTMAFKSNHTLSGMPKKYQGVVEIGIDPKNLVVEGKVLSWGGKFVNENINFLEINEKKKPVDVKEVFSSLSVGDKVKVTYSWGDKTGIVTEYGYGWVLKSESGGNTWLSVPSTTNQMLGLIFGIEVLQKASVKKFVEFENCLFT